MKVVMLQNVKNVGQQDTVVDVSDGFALNALIPQGRAVQATPAQLEALKKRRDARDQAASHLNEETRRALGTLQQEGYIVMRVRANAKGHLFKGITKDDVAVALSEHVGGHLEGRIIQDLEGPIKSTGEYAIRLVGAGESATVRLIIVKDSS